MVTYSKWPFICVTLAIVACIGSIDHGNGAIPHFSARIWPAKQPVPVGHQVQLFVDHYLIAEHRGLTRTTHSPRRALDRPILGWKEGVSQPWVTVIRDADTHTFGLWYNKGLGPECFIAYARSDDGVEWTPPKLGILGDDNRVLRIGFPPSASGYGVSVIDEGPGSPDRSRRFKLAWFGWAQDGGGNPGMCVAFSADGLHWTPWKENPVLRWFGQPEHRDDPRRPYGAADAIDVFWDLVRRRYGGFFKAEAVPSDAYIPGPKAGAVLRRLVNGSISSDFVDWGQPWRVVVPEPRDEGRLEFYSVGGTICRGGLLIGFVRMLHDDYAADRDGPADGIGYTTLVTSRDGRHWQRHEDVFFDRNHAPQAWDHAMTWIGSAVPVGDELFLYYGGYKRGHKIAPLRERQLGLAKMKKDRFVSWEAGDRPGRLITVPLQMPQPASRRLVLNADAATGSIRVQLRDARCLEILPGYGQKECRPVTGDGLALPVLWRDKPDLPSGIFRIEFQITRASLFGFQVLDRPDAGA